MARKRDPAIDGVEVVRSGPSRRRRGGARRSPSGAAPAAACIGRGRRRRRRAVSGNTDGEASNGAPGSEPDPDRGGLREERGSCARGDGGEGKVASIPIQTGERRGSWGGVESGIGLGFHSGWL